MQTCGMCGAKVANLVKSHIIPEAITSSMTVGTIPPLKGSEATGTYVARVRGGFYDRIVCDACEQSFGPADDYFCKFYSDLTDGETISFLDGGRTRRQIRYPRADPQKLHRFFLATLFRGHLSDHENYRSVKLGPFAEQVRKLLLSSNSTVDSSFAVYMRCIPGQHGGLVLSTQQVRSSNRRFYQFYMPNFTFMIKVDNQGVPPEHADFLGASNVPVAELVSHYSDAELEILGRVLALQGNEMDRRFQSMKGR